MPVGSVAPSSCVACMYVCLVVCMYTCLRVRIQHVAQNRHASVFTEFPYLLWCPAPREPRPAQAGYGVPLRLSGALRAGRQVRQAVMVVLCADVRGVGHFPVRAARISNELHVVLIAGGSGFCRSLRGSRWGQLSRAVCAHRGWRVAVRLGSPSCCATPGVGGAPVLPVVVLLSGAADAPPPCSSRCAAPWSWEIGGGPGAVGVEGCRRGPGPRGAGLLRLPAHHGSQLFCDLLSAVRAAHPERGDGSGLPRADGRGGEGVLGRVVVQRREHVRGSCRRFRLRGGHPLLRVFLRHVLVGEARAHVGTELACSME